MSTPMPANEAQRLAALHAYQILDTADEDVFDSITQLAAYICQTPIALISLVDDTRQWFKSRVGVTAHETPRDVAFCAHAILKTEPMIVPDALLDRRFADNSLVRREPRIRFYAGFPLVNPEGFVLGTLCAIDRQPRLLNEGQTRAMQALAHQVIVVMEWRHVSGQLAAELEHVKTLRGLLPICAWCKRIRDDKGYWSQLEAYLHSHADVHFTHGICPECLEKERARNAIRVAD